MDNDIDLTDWTESRVSADGSVETSNHNKKKIFSLSNLCLLREVNSPINKNIILGYRINPIYGAECLGFCQSPSKTKNRGEKWLKYLVRKFRTKNRGLP